MTMLSKSALEWGRFDRLVFDAKRTGLALRRMQAWFAQANEYSAGTVTSRSPNLCESIWSKTIALGGHNGSDPILETGKRLNVRLAARRLHGRLLRKGEVFSFWRAVGKLSADRGFALGAEFRAGCVVPTVGGGVCLVANALYEMALELQFALHERFAHTLLYVDAHNANAPEGVDATLAFPHVDLRFAAPCEVWLSCVVDQASDELRIELFAEQARARGTVHTKTTINGKVATKKTLRVLADNSQQLVSVDRKEVKIGVIGARNCMTCNEVNCHARPKDLQLAPASQTAPKDAA